MIVVTQIILLLTVREASFINLESFEGQMAG